MKRWLAAFIAGLLFGLGLCLSGMTDTSKVLGFLDITGAWDPALIFVMIGAIGVHAAAYGLWLRKRPRPILAEIFSLPQERQADRKLFIGAALFGVGWGMAGFCPGPALISLLSLHQDVIIFVLAMLSGMALFEWQSRRNGISVHR